MDKNETPAETKARWARIDAMHADRQYAEKGCKTKEQAEFWPRFRAAARVQAGPFA
jgi:hypothetical protein